MRMIKYHVVGQRPYDHRINALLRGFDLGVTGAYLPDSNLVTVTLKPGTTNEQILQQPEAIQKAYEELGWIDVKVVTWEME